MTDFGQLRRIGLRDIWRNEATDFTPWLAENLSSLGEVLGMELELLEREAPVGGFSLDILARDVGRNHLVIIENQITATDHDHLGKLLTYAAGYDARTIIWIAESLREEHRQALDWLNQYTNEQIEFYGVEIEIFQIDDSRPVYHFRLVAFPNNWRKSNTRTNENGPSKRAMAYQSFFQELIDELRDRYHFTSAKVGQPQNWYSFASGYSGIVYGINFCLGKQVRAELYIDRGDKLVNESVFEKLRTRKDFLEKEFGEALEWEPLEDRRACRIAVYRPGSIDDDSQTLRELKEWSIQQLLRLKQVFGSILGEVMNEAS